MQNLPVIYVRSIEHTVMHHDDVKAINTESQPDNVVPSPAVTRPADGGELSAVLPALSWNMIRLIK